MMRHKGIAAAIFAIALLTACNQEEKDRHGPFQFINLAAAPKAATITRDMSTGVCTQSVGTTNTPFVDLSIKNGDRITWTGALKNGGTTTHAAAIEIEFAATSQNPGSGLGTPFRTQNGGAEYFLSPAPTIGPVAPVDTSMGYFKFAFVELFDENNKAYTCTPPDGSYGVHVQQ